MTSEIAEMRKQLETEIRALKHMGMFSSVASHKVIQHQLTRIEASTRALDKHIGVKAADMTMCDVYSEVME